MDNTATEQKTVIALVSASLPEHLTEEENEERTQELAEILKKKLTDPWKALPVQGCYKGQFEDSFKVNVTDPQDLALVDALARKFDTASYLVVDSSRVAWLYYLKGATKRLGQFEAVGEYEAKAQDAWTFDPESNTYFIVK